MASNQRDGGREMRINDRQARGHGFDLNNAECLRFGAEFQRYVSQRFYGDAMTGIARQLKAEALYGQLVKRVSEKAC
jgi:hypothetical protein